MVNDSLAVTFTSRYETLIITFYPEGYPTPVLVLDGENQYVRNQMSIAANFIDVSDTSMAETCMAISELQQANVMKHGDPRIEEI
jgi:hypothetical protein